jgi:threonine/homoserine/homoserine lactone efflux protein
MDLTSPLFGLFLLAAFALAITPGPGIAYVLARTVSGGRADGLASTAGTALGGMVHVVAAAAGLSALLMQSAGAFTVVRWLGAVYWSTSASARCLRVPTSRRESRRCARAARGARSAKAWSSRR